MAVTYNTGPLLAVIQTVINKYRDVTVNSLQLSPPRLSLVVAMALDIDRLEPLHTHTMHSPHAARPLALPRGPQPVSPSAAAPPFLASREDATVTST